MFGLFKKKEGVDHYAHKKIEQLNTSVSGSFKNIKRDMDTVNDWLTHLKEFDNSQNKKIESLERQLAIVLKKLESHEQVINSHGASIEAINVPTEEIYEEQEIESEPEEIQEEPGFILPKGTEKIAIKSMINSLTETQKIMFIKLLSLQRESGGWVPFKTLAEEIYPEKEYGDVRSTISEYLTLLSEWGLVTKKRTGKQSFVSVTQKGEELIQHISDESKKASKILIKKKR